MAKDKGFDWNCPNYSNEYGALKNIDNYLNVFWSCNSNVQYNCRFYNIKNKDKLIKMMIIPSQSILQQWLREECNIHISVHKNVYKNSDHDDFVTEFTATINDFDKTHIDYNEGLRFSTKIPEHAHASDKSSYEDALEEALTIGLGMI